MLDSIRFNDDFLSNVALKVLKQNLECTRTSTMRDWTMEKKKNTIKAWNPEYILCT